jgi:hypothetical protein
MYSRAMARSWWCVATCSLIVACTTPPAKDTALGASSQTIATTSAAPSITASTIAGVEAGIAPIASADAAPPPVAVSTESWATLATTKKTLVARYPADVFTKTKIAGESILLQSDLKRSLLGEGTGNKVHRYEIEIDWVTGTPFEAVRKKFKTYPFPQMFPKGTEDSYTEIEGEGQRVTIEGHVGYRVHTGVEGYDEDTVLLASGDKKTLRFRCTYVGSVMGPEIDDEKQVAICDAVLASLFSSKNP